MRAIHSYLFMIFSGIELSSDMIISEKDKCTLGSGECYYGWCRSDYNWRYTDIFECTVEDSGFTQLPTKCSCNHGYTGESCMEKIKGELKINVTSLNCVVALD